MKKILIKNGLNFTKRQEYFFMSVFDKNKDEMLNINKVKKILFEDDIEQYFAGKQINPKGPFLEKPLNELKLTIQQKKDLKRNKTYDRRKIGKERSILQKCRVKIQKAMSLTRRTHLDKFGYFDFNQDGYVGLGDVKNRFLKMRVFSEKELNYLVKHFSKIYYFLILRTKKWRTTIIL